MAMTMPGKAFNESDMNQGGMGMQGIHTMNQPAPVPRPNSNHGMKAPAPTPQRLPALRQEGYNGGGGMGSPIMKGRVLEGPLGIMDTRSLPNVGEGTFSHITDYKGRESTDSDRRRKQFNRMRTMPNAPLTRSAMSMPDDDKPKLFNPDPMPYQASNFKILRYDRIRRVNPPLARVRVEGTGVMSLPKLDTPRGPSNLSHDRSSTVIKKVPTMHRHQDMWGGPGPLDVVGKHRGFVMHAERYQLQINAEAYPRPPGWNQPPTGPIGLDLSQTGNKDYHGPAATSRTTRPDLFPNRPLTELGHPRPNSSVTRATFPLDNYHAHQAFFHAHQHHTPLPELPSPIVTKGLNSAFSNYHKWNDYSRGGVESGSSSQRDRMALEQEYMERMKIYKRRREIIQHREPVDLLLGGEKVAYTERLDITGEINRLKQVVLPKKAKDLYVGRGFVLPSNHTLNKQPKRLVPAAVSKDTPSFAKALSRAPTISRDPPQKANLPKSMSSSIKPQTLEIDPHAGNGDALATNKNKQKSSGNPADASGDEGKWSKPEGNDKPGNASLNEAAKVDIIRPESDMEIKLVGDNKDDTDDPPHVPSPTKSASPNKGVIGNPLKGIVHGDETKVEGLREAFKRHDADSDGHIKYESMKPELPEGLSKGQEAYIKQIYETCCSNSLFGEDEFVSTVLMSQRITSLSGKASDAFDALKEGAIEESLSQYTELFESVDRQETGKLSLESFKEILSTTFGAQVEESKFEEIKTDLKLNIPDLSDSIGKQDFIVLIPFFISLESSK